MGGEGREIYFSRRHKNLVLFIYICIACKKRET